MADFTHLEVVELLWKARVFTDSLGDERTIWERWWAVFDAEATEEHGWFAIVRRIHTNDLARGYKRLTCACDERWEESGVECSHERAVIAHLGPEPDERPAMLPNIAAFVD